MISYEPNLSNNKLLLTFCILQYGIKSLKAREEILEKKASEFRDCSLSEFSPTDSQNGTIAIMSRTVENSFR